MDFHRISVNAREISDTVESREPRRKKKRYSLSFFTLPKLIKKNKSRL